MPKSPIDRFFDEVLFPKMDEAFDMLADRFINHQPEPRRIPHTPSPRGKKKRVHRAGDAPTTRKSQRSRPTPANANTITYYTIFEVSPHASLEVITAAHRVLVKKYHPDTAGASGEAKIRLINAAWEVLQDPAKRRAYDRSMGIR